MKQIRNWKVIEEHFNAYNALYVLQNQKMEGYTGPFAIRHRKTGKMLTKYAYDQMLNSDEIMVHEWNIMVPDTDEEKKCEKIRGLAKESDCSGLTYSKIDNMTNKEIWKHLCSKMNSDQIYKMLLLYYENKIYKTK